jgi:ubiquinol-cytochrome c reductase cytochrome b subunit
VAVDWRGWLTDRFALKPIKKNVLDRRVPKAPWYYGDGATLLLLFGVLVVTGMAMALTYSPSPDTAYDSVVYITEEQLLGRFVRGLHYWAAGLMVVMLLLHLFRQIILGGYKFPREGTWLVGVGLFFLVLTMAFTGYVLRWDERAVYAATVVLHMFQRVPLIGNDLVVFVQGGTELSAMTLTRLYAVHVVIVPMLIMAFAGYHLYLVITKGVSPPAEREQPIHSVQEQERIYKETIESEERGEYFYPDTTVKSGRMALAVFSLVVVLAVVVGPGALYPEANLAEPSAPAEEWWFWWYSALIALLPPRLAGVVFILLPVLLFVVLVSLPFLDRGPWRAVRKRPWAVAAVLGVVIALLVLTELRVQSPWTGWPSDVPPFVPEGVELSEPAEQGRQLFAAYGCNACHSVASSGPEVAVDLARIGERRSRDEMRAFILQPPEGVAMPAYARRITEEELELLLEFVHVAQTFPRE